MEGRVAGIDVHKRMLAVVICERSDSGTRVQQRKFGTTTVDLRQLREWLAEWQVKEAAMESTAQYWKTVWLELESHCVLHLAQARSTAAPKGRKSDFADAHRIVKRLVAGDLTISYVPEPEQRRWRLLSRTRTQLIEDRTRIQSQMECILEESRIKLSSFVSDLLGVTSRKILRALAEGADDIQALAAQAAQHVRTSKEKLVEALTGEVHPTHRKLLKMHLDRIESLDQDIAGLEKELGTDLSANEPVVRRLCGIPGVSAVAAQGLIAEVGPEAAAFKGPEKLSSWVGVCPGREESAEVSRSNRSPKGNRAMRRLLTQIAFAAVRQKDTFFHGLFGRLVPRLGVKKAIWAVAHRILRLIWKVLHEKVDYQEKGSLPQDAKSVQRRTQKFKRDMRRLGYNVQVSPIAAKSVG